jgi:AcrR family transcriptional regulator
MDMVKRSKEEAAETRQLIMDTAQRLFLAQGFAATPTRQIAQEAGVTVGAVYTHFESKEALWKCIFIERHPFFLLLPLLNEAQGDTAEALITDMAKRMIGSLSSQPDFLNLMFIEIVEFQKRNLPDLLGRIFPLAMPLIMRLQKLDGALRAIPPEILLRSFAGYFFSYYMTGKLIPDEMYRTPEETTMHWFLEIYLHGIIKPSIEDRHE